MTKRLKIWVYGQVQGVGFRYHTYTMASQLGILGWCRNLSDGSVEIVAEAGEDRLDQFLAYVKEGPMFARVDTVKVRDLAEDERLHRFKIR